MFAKVVAVVAFAAFANAQYGHQSATSYSSSSNVAAHGEPIRIQGGHGAVPHGHLDETIDYHAHPKYEFKYGVKDDQTGDHKTQQEIRDGDVVKGEYTLVDPDGTIRKVEYSADDQSGFNAVVSRTGHASHPEVLHQKPVLSAQILDHPDVHYSHY